MQQLGTLKTIGPLTLLRTLAAKLNPGRVLGSLDEGSARLSVLAGAVANMAVPSQVMALVRTEEGPVGPVR